MDSTCPKKRELSFDINAHRQALSTGRPPSFARDYIDCKFPTTNDDPTKEGDENDCKFLLFEIQPRAHPPPFAQLELGGSDLHSNA